MSKKKPEKVWMFYGNRFLRYSWAGPRAATFNRRCNAWQASGYESVKLGWDKNWQTFADEDKAKVALFAKGFLACQAMYAEMFKEAESE